MKSLEMGPAHLVSHGLLEPILGVHSLHTKGTY